MMSNPEFDEVYHRYRDKVMGYIIARVNNRADAEDLCSDVFEKVFRRMDSYAQHRSSISTWIYTITHNTVIDYYRKTRPCDELDENLSDGTQVESGLLREETLAELASALGRLPEDQRDILVLMYYDEKPMTEVARLMGLSYGAVKLRRQKALDGLRKLMDQ